MTMIPTDSAIFSFSLSFYKIKVFVIRKVKVVVGDGPVVDPLVHAVEGDRVEAQVELVGEELVSVEV